MRGRFRAFAREDEFADAEAWARDGGLAIGKAPSGLWEGEFMLLCADDVLLELLQDDLRITSPMGSFRGCWGSTLGTETLERVSEAEFHRLALLTARR